MSSKGPVPHANQLGSCDAAQGLAIRCRISSELSPRTFCTFFRELSSRRRTSRTVLEELNGVSQRPTIIRMMTTSRPQQRYDHRLRHRVQRTGDPTIAADLGVPRSTARGWLGAAPTVVVSLEGADLTEPELRQEILKLQRRVEKLAALLRLALALLGTSGFRLSGARLPDGHAKHAWRPTNQRPARRARHSTRPHDAGRPPFRPRASRALEATLGERDRARSHE